MVLAGWSGPTDASFGWSSSEMTVTVWHLELLDRTAFNGSTTPLRYRLERIVAPSAEFLRFLYVAAGTDWTWTDRLPWTKEQWLARQSDATVEFWVAFEDGAPAGYFELARLDDGRTVELVYFGLLPHAVGKGQGGAMLTAAIDRMWEMGAGRLYVNTCSLDHPRALGNYEARGFSLFRETSR